jgi:hypothetical protein
VAEFCGSDWLQWSSNSSAQRVISNLGFDFQARGTNRRSCLSNKVGVRVLSRMDMQSPICDTFEIFDSHVFLGFVSAIGILALEFGPLFQSNAFGGAREFDRQLQ